MTSKLDGISHNPDILSCLANLSNDEVFTPPHIVNKMLDLLPQNLFQNPETKFLDPACKSGVFLREIAKRLIAGLVDIFPDLQKRIDHILHNQLYGIAVTELTSLVSRRTLYCSKYPQCRFSISKFENAEGNIRFRSIKHTWKNGKCVWCGAPESVYHREDGLESHAYEPIHQNNPEKFFDMKFDVIIGNPPYQLNLGNEGGNSSKAKAIYHKFIDMADDLHPRHIVMITPSRWMTRSVEGISEKWFKRMFERKDIKELYDYEDPAAVFPGIDLPGGVSYFHIQRDYEGNAKYVFCDKEGNESVRDCALVYKNTGVIVRNPKVFSILNKIEDVEGEYHSKEMKNMQDYVSPKDFFTTKTKLTSKWDAFKTQRSAKYCIKYLTNAINKRQIGYVSIDQIPKNAEAKDLHKVFVPAANGSTDKILGQPVYGPPNSVCSQTFLVIGYDKKHKLDEIKCNNIMGYIRTKFFRFLVSIKKVTQNGPRSVYQLVPVLDFTQSWTNKKLYERYDLTEPEIQLIEDSIKPMEAED